MRISDWSSDVCSSDLDDRFGIDQRREGVILPERIDLGHIGDVERRLLEAHEIGQDLHPVKQGIDIPMDVPFGGALRTSRSEERRVGKECVSTCNYRWSRYH